MPIDWKQKTMAFSLAVATLFPSTAVAGDQKQGDGVSSPPGFSQRINPLNNGFWGLVPLIKDTAVGLKNVAVAPVASVVTGAKEAVSEFSQGHVGAGALAITGGLLQAPFSELGAVATAVGTVGSDVVAVPADVVGLVIPEGTALAQSIRDEHISGQLGFQLGPEGRAVKLGVCVGQQAQALNGQAHGNDYRALEQALAAATEALPDTPQNVEGTQEPASEAGPAAVASPVEKPGSQERQEESRVPSGQTSPFQNEAPKSAGSSGAGAKGAGSPEVEGPSGDPKAKGFSLAPGPRQQSLPRGRNGGFFLRP